jgi:hypothetical protein
MSPVGVVARGYSSDELTLRLCMGPFYSCLASESLNQYFVTVFKWIMG